MLEVIKDTTRCAYCTFSVNHFMVLFLNIFPTSPWNGLHLIGMLVEISFDL